MKSPEGENQENTEGSIKVRFGGQVEVKKLKIYIKNYIKKHYTLKAQPSRLHYLCEITLQLTPIIADPEYLLDQHILICVKSTDCDESYGKELPKMCESLLVLTCS